MTASGNVPTLDKSVLALPDNPVLTKVSVAKATSCDVGPADHLPAASFQIKR